MSMVDGGALVGKALANEGVENAFVLCGGHIMPIFYGMRNAGIEIIDMRHECAAMYAAIGYTRVFHHTGEEIPYAVAVAIEEFDESRRPDLVRIRAVIYVEKQSQKGIVIGKVGRLLKVIGQEARAEMEKLLEARVFLDLWVKVWKNWRKDPRAIRALGYQS